jgi:S1-C subfamily serine protease
MRTFRFGACIAVVLTAAALTPSSHSEPVATDMQIAIGTAWPLTHGVLVTSHHVVSDHDHVVLVTHQGGEIEATVVLRDESGDIAFLVADDPAKLPAALPISHAPATLGASVFTIGYPRADVMGESPKLTDGVISSVNGVRDDPDSYQISVPIQPGNSGGPLVNMRGEVVGVVSGMLAITNGDGKQVYTNINYAVKIDVVRELLDILPEEYQHTIDAVPHTDTSLEDLATRIQDSILMVKLP